MEHLRQKRCKNKQLENNISINDMDKFEKKKKN